MRASKGRQDKRQAMAVMVAVGDRPAPLTKEFAITNADRAAVSALADRLGTILNKADIKHSNVILAALAELSARYMREPKLYRQKGKRRTVS